jgi:hypothetical protein
MSVHFHQTTRRFIPETELSKHSAVSGSCIENREYGLGISHSDYLAPSIRKKLAITSPTSGGRSVGIVSLRTQTMEFSFSLGLVVILLSRSMKYN